MRIKRNGSNAGQSAASSKRCKKEQQQVKSGDGDDVGHDGYEQHDRLARHIDHTCLKPDAKRQDILKLCEEAIRYGFRTVCVNSCWIASAKQYLDAHDSKNVTEPIAVVGFPLGCALSSAKASETKACIALGAKEIDMVINVGRLKDKDYAYVYDDIHTVVSSAGSIPVKVILETCLLSDEEKVIACALAKAAGADFVKTSTGFSKGGASVSDVALMRRVVGEEMGVKASGGIRTSSDARKMIEAGAGRIGASKSVQIVTGEQSLSKEKGY